MASDLQMSPQLEQIHGEIRDNFRALASGIKDVKAQFQFRKIEVEMVSVRFYTFYELASMFSTPFLVGTDYVKWLCYDHITNGKVGEDAKLKINGFQRLDKIKDSNRQSKQLEELTGRMRECKRLIKDLDREIKDEEARNPPEVNKRLNDEKQSMIKELNSYVALRKTYMNSLGNKKVELFDMGGASEPTADENVQMASGKFNFS
ncbi:hypothetical protein EZV62_000071 [Acer yangbiense]|uniref:Uncharacterized protein n=1 Tax=Acer yangbiense TaxID=1000413 RepID=A0A5C7ISW4_9ROSI|nr:hypothetical protein EZV62_000071 [Acer yangbiense]